MATTALPTPTLRRDRSAVTDAYGNARLPASAHDDKPERVDKIPYGRFRNVYLYITEACQLRCEHCYMGERLERAFKMPYPSVMDTLTTWRKMGGSKLTILGGEPTLHPDYIRIIRDARALGYEHVITTSNGLKPAARKFAQMTPEDFSYVQISLDGGSPDSHDRVRGTGTFNEALETIAQLCERGFDTRIICTVNRANLGDCLNLLDIADDLGVSLTKFHVFSVIGSGHGAAEWGIGPQEWIDFYEDLERVAKGHKTRVWYQPTYARRERMAGYAQDGYRGCIGRTLDRISIFPDGRAYVCSFLFDTDLHFANMVDGKVVLNKEANEFDLFAGVLREASCGSCKIDSSCMGGCPAEELVMGTPSCASDPDIVPVCRLWKADVPTTHNA
ncbi:radical SAM/SPASM domain-containing protein [Streptosporangium sandarakinum]|uniref:radical SAM/SPASM domain-containing protein n=1 Tax=Streptosporangium sandarakinum TaxID=1260955 RepID=UPI0034363166